MEEEKSEINMHSPVCDDHNPHSKNHLTHANRQHTHTKNTHTQTHRYIQTIIYMHSLLAIIKLSNMKNYRNDMDLCGETMGETAYIKEMTNQMT